MCRQCSCTFLRQAWKDLVAVLSIGVAERLAGFAVGGFQSVDHMLELDLAGGPAVEQASCLIEALESLPSGVGAGAAAAGVALRQELAQPLRPAIWRGAEPVFQLGQRLLHDEEIARSRQQLACTDKALRFPPVGGVGKPRTDQAQQRAQALQAAAGIVNSGGDVVLAAELGGGNVDLLEPDAAHALRNGLLQLEPIGHAWTKTRGRGDRLTGTPIHHATLSQSTGGRGCGD